MRSTLLLLLFLLFSAIHYVNSQNLTFSPNQPAPGDEVTFQYDPTGTPTEGAETIEAVAWLLGGGMPEAIEMELQQQDQYYIGNFSTHTDTKAAFVTFKHMETDVVDVNSNRGYKIMMYQAGEPVQEARGHIAHAYAGYEGLFGLESDPEMAMKYLTEEFEVFPESKKNLSFLSKYAWLSSRAKNTEVVNQLRAQAERVLEEEQPTEEELLHAMYLAQNLKDQELAEKIKKKVREQYPYGRSGLNARFETFYKASEISEKERIYREIKETFGGHEDFPRIMESLNQNMARYYADKHDYDNFMKYAELIRDRFQRGRTYTDMAKKLAGMKPDDAPINMEQAKELTSRSIQLIEEELETLATKPPHVTKSRWRKHVEIIYGWTLDNQAQIHYKEGDYESALATQTTVCEVHDFKNPRFNGRYTLYHAKVHGPQATMTILEDMISGGTANPFMKRQYKELFTENLTLEQAFEKQLAALEKEAAKIYNKEIEEKLIDEPAPDFRLMNLDGKEVALRDLKGKVVVLDFWATWCGPCKASFPGMQKAVDKYKENEDVAFLFIDTWEKGEDKEKKVAEFIQANNYTFNVLMDMNDEVVAQYEVRGIPTKFVVGKNGRIRYKSIGHRGSDDKLLNEISAVLEILGGGAGAPLR